MSRLRAFFAPSGLSIQTTLFPWVEEELGALTEKQQQLVPTLEIIRVEDHLPRRFHVPGRPATDRAPIARVCRGEGRLRQADDERAARPAGPRCVAAAYLRLGAEERGPQRVRVLTRLRRVRRHGVPAARPRRVGPENVHRPAAWSPLPRLDRHRGPRARRPPRGKRPSPRSGSEDDRKREQSGRSSSRGCSGRAP